MCIPFDRFAFFSFFFLSFYFVICFYLLTVSICVKTSMYSQNKQKIHIYYKNKENLELSHISKYVCGPFPLYTEVSTENNRIQLRYI